MSDPFIGEVRLASFSFAPKGWAFCNGQLLPINQNQPLFALLGTTYGGDGRVNFALPNLQGRLPLHVGPGIALGAAGGVATVALTSSQMPQHTHYGTAAAAASTTDPTNAEWTTAADVVAWSGDTASQMAPTAIAPTGSSQPHSNLSPYAAVTFMIALQGIFPSRS